MIFNEIFCVYLDGNFIGLTDREDCVWEVAQNYLNGYETLYDDDCDRIWSEKINVNRWFVSEKAPMNVCDKYNIENSILCRNKFDAEETSDMLNKIEREKERTEARLRALLL